ncbi:hypothetical protein Tco_0945342 [Tanacetum coccineum]
MAQQQEVVDVIVKVMYLGKVNEVDLNDQNLFRYFTNKEGINILLLGLPDEIYQTVDAAKSANEITDPTSPTDAPRTKIQTVADLTGNDKLRYEADIDAMNWILLGIPNDIYNSVDACQNAKAMWNRVKRLMQGTDLSLQERHSRLMNEFDKFSAEAGESLESNEPNVNASRAKRTARNHDPLALVANTYASPSYSRPSQSYYVTHPPLVQDYDDDYQGEVQSDDPKDKLSTTMMLLA